MELQKVDEIIGKYDQRSGALIEILLDVQEELHYLPPEAIWRISDSLKVPMSRIYHLATFFNAFSLEPKGKYCISVCLGTACHVAGAVKIIEKLERDLEVTRGSTSKDMKFSLDEVHCLGCCGLAPVVTVNEELYGKLSLTKVASVMKKYTKKELAQDEQD